MANGTFPDCGYCRYFVNRSGSVREASSRLICQKHNRLLPYHPNGHLQMLCIDYVNYKSDETATSWSNPSIAPGILYSYASPYNFSLREVCAILDLPAA